MITIKPLNAIDIPKFVEVHLKCWEETYYALFPAEVMDIRRSKKQNLEKHILKRLQEDHNYFYYCLYDDFHVVGIMIFSILEDHGILDALYIKKEYQHMGYGMNMIKIMESVLKENHVFEYSIYVFKLLSSNAFFQKSGAVCIREDLVSIHGKDYQEYEYIKKVVE